jgi:hypothetical protein
MRFHRIPRCNEPRCRAPNPVRRLLSLRHVARWSVIPVLPIDLLGTIRVHGLLLPELIANDALIMLDAAIRLLFALCRHPAILQ